MVTTENARKVLDNLVERLDSEVIACFVEKRLFAREADIPMRKWSMLNQLTAYFSGTSDARGFRQWQAVGRHVTKGSRALYILVPMIRIKTATTAEAQTQETEEQEREYLAGFRAMPVFRVEDTEGEPLVYQSELDAFDPSRFPLFDIAKTLGVTVTTAVTESCYGWYSNDQKLIALGTDDVTTFFHELSHAVDSHLPGTSDDTALRECAAELSSCFLCHLYRLPPHDGHTKAYLENFSGKGHVAFSIARVVERVLAISQFIAAHTATLAPCELPA